MYRPSLSKMMEISNSKKTPTVKYLLAVILYNQYAMNWRENMVPKRKWRSNVSTQSVQNDGNFKFQKNTHCEVSFSGHIVQSVRNELAREHGSKEKVAFKCIDPVCPK